MADNEPEQQVTRGLRITSATGFDLLIVGDYVRVTRGPLLLTEQQAPGLERFVRAARELRVGWATFATYDVLYVFDRRQDNFGYAINLSISAYSEWGRAPYPPMPEESV